VPPSTTVAYLTRFPQQRVHRYPDFDHQCCWAGRWPQWLQRAIDDLD